MLHHIIDLRKYVPRCIVAGISLLFIIAINLAASVIVYISPLRQFVISRMQKMRKKNTDETDPEKLLLSIPGLNTMSTMWQAMSSRIYDNLDINQSAPDVKIITLEGKEKNLLSFAKQGRPLVLKFGSCS